MSKLRIATREDISKLVNKRPGETKLGEKVQVAEGENLEDALKASSASFVLLGIPEDIGVRANFGVGGAHTLWQPALKALLNVQHTNELNGEKLLVLGAFDLSELMERARSADVPALREMVTEIDDAVSPVIEQIIKAGKIPIVIGGGHNNAYPLLRGAANANRKKLSCINLDAHSDYRVKEGRHSGNGFRYAKEEGYLEKYAVIGLHKNYNSQDIIDELDASPDILYSTYEDIFLDGQLGFDTAVDHAINHTHRSPVGIELDLDCIEHTLSSAATPCGIDTLKARQYVATCAKKLNLAYLHLIEGAVKLDDGREDASTAKLVAYLVTDLMRNYPGK